LNKEEVKTIFESFKQAQKSNDPNEKGTGLGLPIAQKLLHLLGGKLFVRSKKGQGTTFYFDLSLQKALNIDHIEKTKLESDTSKKIEFKEDKPKILIAEDNEMNISYISRLYDQWDIPYKIVMNGKEACEEYQREEYDMIFMDLQMPVMSGYEATMFIRSTPKDTTKPVPIIALTASTLTTKQELARKSGMSDFLSKPFLPQQMKAMILKHTSKDQVVHRPIKQNFKWGAVPHLDQQTLHELYGDDKNQMRTMFELYLSVVDKEIRRLEEAIARENPEHVARVLQKMKPNFLMVALNDLAESSMKLEVFLKNNSWEDQFKFKLLDFIKTIQQSKSMVKRENQKLNIVNHGQHRLKN
jgi:CheY-like chemotaxis protein